MPKSVAFLNRKLCKLISFEIYHTLIGENLYTRSFAQQIDFDNTFTDTSIIVKLKELCGK